MLNKFKSLFSKTPWGFDSYEYVGIENQCYTYLVTFTKGKETKIKTYKFHAHTTHRDKDADKLIRYFTAEAAQMA